MNRSYALLISAFLMFAGVAQGRPLDAVGKCPIGEMTLARERFEGNATILKTIPAFVTKHAAGAAQEESWLRELAEPSGRNRLYRQGDQQIIVATLCDPTDCEGIRAYVAYEPATGAWGASLYEGRHVRELGEHPEERFYASQLANPIICAQNLDWGK